ncbi:MAG: radical SAM-associated putative lipoprotein [Bacteroidales bacterium]|jgi:putative lipoprotein (rSAM/lipoprotein system)|nr:radical SAM-associated putative lipoprotein [Bacteroidales bacterium]MDD4214762.1 radical SAM-associated putative lipoprotein [Bacteroidales bacterium]
MKLKFNKWLFSIIAFIFGFSGTVAAQYGVIENHYLVKGNVKSEKCLTGIPQIKITLKATDENGVDYFTETLTDDKGNYTIDLDNSKVLKFENYLMTVIDEDGKENQGDFQSTRQQVVLRKNDFTKSDFNNWNQYYDSKNTYNYALKFKKDQPCK